VTLLDDCEREARALLNDNLSEEGILAAAPGSLASARGYARVFARDAAVCILGMAASGEPRLMRGALTSLATLAAQQAPNGQIPKYADRREGDFWYLGCIDATLWWLIALDWLKRRGASPPRLRALAPAARRALAWLACQEHPAIGLLQQNEASDWADIMPRSGFVLYTNALWYWVKRSYALPGTALTRRHFNQLFFPSADDLPGYKRLRLLAHYARRRRRSELYLSFVNLATRGDEGDVFGNLLALLVGLCDGARAKAILREITHAQRDSPYPIRATLEPITPYDPLWRGYMTRHRQNLEHQYHNGGIWPMIGGFWVAALARFGMSELARAELEQLADANRVGGWEFNEWFHGLSGKPSGMARQSWNAAMFLVARRAVQAI
jgi:glycogen debranching enzyme